MEAGAFNISKADGVFSRHIYTSWSVAVTTTKKSQAMMAVA
jgi:hypothetical protein